MTETMELTITEQLVGTLTATWRAIRAHHEEVPDVVLTLGSGTLGRRGGETVLGHFAQSRWSTADGRKHELFIGGEGLAQGARCVMATLLHEAAHALAAVRQIKDTSRQGRYHNAKFKALAQEMGLSVTEDKSIGWSPSTITEDAAARYADEIHALTSAIRAHRVSEHNGQTMTPGGNEDGEQAGDDDQGEQDGDESKKKDSNLAVATCGCEKPRKLRIARSTLELAPITCGACGQDFAPAGAAAPAEVPLGPGSARPTCAWRSSPATGSL